MPIRFTYRTKNKPMFYNDLVPGRILFGKDSSIGHDGEVGKKRPSIYFSDYTPDDDYVKTVLLDKIKKNMILSSGRTQKLIGIEYTDGDLIITEKKYVYKLIRKEREFDFEFLGNIVGENQTNEEIQKDNLLDNIVEVNMYGIDSSYMEIPCPSNRCMDSSTNISTSFFTYKGLTIPLTVDTDLGRDDVSVGYADAGNIVYGISFFPFLIVRDEEKISNYDFYLKIYMKNIKSPQGSSYTIDEKDILNFENPEILDPVEENSSNRFHFYKCSELKLYPITDASLSDVSMDSSNYNNFYKCHITDMSCDKLHPSGNNIESNCIDTNFSIPCNNGTSRIGGINNATGVREPHITNEDSSYYGMPGIVRESHINSDKVFSLDKKIFRSNFYSSTIGYLQYSKRRIGDSYVPNFRGGDSAYFSGMTRKQFSQDSFGGSSLQKGGHVLETRISELSTYDNFVSHINCTKLDSSHKWDSNDTSTLQEKRINEESLVVSKAVQDFYFNTDNIYELVCADVSTGKTYSIILNNKVRLTPKR